LTFSPGGQRPAGGLLGDFELGAGRGDFGLGRLLVVFERLVPALDLGDRGLVVGLRLGRVFLRGVDGGRQVADLRGLLRNFRFLLVGLRLPVDGRHERHRGDAEEQKRENHDHDHEDLADERHGPILPIRRKTADRPPGQVAATSRAKGGGQSVRVRETWSDIGVRGSCPRRRWSH